ncbi:saccharopine dehydrogenase family protein [Jannaschia marina]|uniref:saccharopine dehydrogenase n=1 Tax=Jannaschia marina TaxID=2741674 RepID=UPI0015CC580F|nr:saccharopine dehydrogenase [Jannaschia marina]
MTDDGSGEGPVPRDPRGTSATGMRVLVIGGTGVFGSRLVAGLRQSAGLDVLVAGRGAGNDVVLDRNAPDLARRIAAEKPDIVIDAAGPFQDYGAAPYAVAEAAIAARAHYLDLSDDADFTVGIAALDPAARAAGVAAISGVSTVPAISSAAVVVLSEGLDDIHLIDSFIVPGNRAPRGLSVMRAILAQAGQPMTEWRAGRPRRTRGWGDLRRVHLPGLGRRWVSAIGAPDLALFPAAYRARSVRFGAGLELTLLHLGLWAMSLPVRWGLLRSLAYLARPMRRLAALFEPFGSDRGGMRVRVVGKGRMDRSGGTGRWWPRPATGRISPPCRAA